ncbi:MAG: MBL fold metallo-hydrolase [Terriglobia bacterium]|nr:MBL fold metallo-hydrolase [Terriglobia bacterium]
MTSHVLLSNGAAYIVDCGLGVTAQLARTGIPFSAVRSIFITHHHPDHNVEYGPFLLLRWAKGITHSPSAYGPPPLAQMTRDYLRSMDATIRFWSEDFEFPPLHMDDVHEVTGTGPVMKDENVRVTSTVVQHPPVRPAFGYRFDFADRSIAFSGDTVPLEAVARMAHGADVLVHEAIDMAVMDRMERLNADPTQYKINMHHMRADHSPIEDVGRIAQQAGVKTLVLSHLAPSIGIPDETWRAAAAKHFTGNIIVGHDLMVI